ncbi:ribonuclease domain-containing protein [Acetobacter indonesiensis]
MPHHNDGAIFGNRETILPTNYFGYYHEYVLSPPLGAALWCVFTQFVHCSLGCYFPGPMRLVYGAGGEIFFTSDHYVTFVRVK